MKRYIFFILSILSALFLQLLFATQINLIRIKPDFLLLLVVFLSFYANFKEGVVVGLLAGFLKDSFSGGIFGANIFSYLICTLILDQYKSYIYREDLYLKVILVFLISLINGLLNYFTVLSRISIPFFSSFLLVILPESLYTTLVSPVIFWLMRRCVLKYSI